MLIALLCVCCWGRVNKCCPCTGHSHSHSQYEHINVRTGFCLKNPDPRVKASCCQHSGNNNNVQRCLFELSLDLDVCLRLNGETHGTTNIHMQPCSIEEDSEVQSQRGHLHLNGYSEGSGYVYFYCKHFYFWYDMINLILVVNMSFSSCSCCTGKLPFRKWVSKQILAVVFVSVF